MITDHGIEGGPVYAHSGALRDAIDRDGRCTMISICIPTSTSIS